MELTPRIYHKIVRPKWITRKYIHNLLNDHISFNNKKVLDFGSGTGANCHLFGPTNYFGVDTDEKRISFAKTNYPKHQFAAIKNKLPLSNQSIDIILIIAVLHHIEPKNIPSIIKEFLRVLDQDGQIVILEPCLSNKTIIKNWFMQTVDKGKYIQNENSYMDYFQTQGFTCKKIKKFTKCFLYNELFFVASLK